MRVIKALSRSWSPPPTATAAPSRTRFEITIFELPTLTDMNAAVLDTDGITLMLTFDKPLNEQSVAAAAFTVTATPTGGSAATGPLAVYQRSCGRR